ncbi:MULTISPECIES: alkylphosphonate utilization protein [unclassified Helicobacter]|uniref:alkylphosphonate utilization protein n=1 Tax=unclassified Helicobacter TaxID=2593540 RepID=UPI000CF07E35|nr:MULTISPECIES: alkylphosphonate utilization protein [unclassified Helicobacter]
MYKDSNGMDLSAGDSVQVIKDLKLKGSSGVIKRGVIVKNIKLGNKEGEIEGRVDKQGVVVLKTCFLKKV